MYLARTNKKNIGSASSGSTFFFLAFYLKCCIDDILCKGHGVMDNNYSRL
jgi:hypothetical protein